MIKRSNLVYVTEDRALYDVTVVHDGEILGADGRPMPATFEYTVSATDMAPVAQFLRFMQANDPMEIADYVVPPPPPELTIEQKLALAGLSERDMDELIARSIARRG